MTEKNQFKRMWNEAIMEYFKVVSRYLPGGTEKNHGEDQSGSDILLLLRSRQELIHLG
jgi:hypothetical protein